MLALGPKWEFFTRKEFRRWKRTDPSYDLIPEAVSVCRSCGLELAEFLSSHFPGYDSRIQTTAQEDSEFTNILSNTWCGELEDTNWSHNLHGTFHCVPVTVENQDEGVTAPELIANFDVRESSGAVPEGTCRELDLYEEEWFPDFAVVQSMTVATGDASTEWNCQRLDQYEAEWFPNIRDEQNNAQMLSSRLHLSRTQEQSIASLLTVADNSLPSENQQVQCVGGNKLNCSLLTCMEPRQGFNNPMTCNSTEPADLTDKRKQCRPPMTTTSMTSVGTTELPMYVRCMSHPLFLESMEFIFTFCEFTHSEFIHLVSRNFSMSGAVNRHDFSCKVNCFTGISCSCDSCSHPDTRSVTTCLGGVHHDTHSASIHYVSTQLHSLCWMKSLGCVIVSLASTMLAILCIAEGVTAHPNQEVFQRSVFDRLLAWSVHIQGHPILFAVTTFIIGVVMATILFGMMVPSNSNWRVPNAWGPEMEQNYSFRQWSRDVLLWSIANEADPSRKAASVMLVLRGAAKELARQIPPQVIVQGGVINGVQVDPLTYLMHSLQERFGNLGEEVRVQTITELMGFQRKNHETIDSLLVRFDTVRTRAAEQGGAVVSIQGISWLLLRAIGISDNQLIQLLSPFQGLFPATEAEFTQLKTSLRRMGHVLERAPGNIREGFRQTPGQSAFLTEPSNSQSQHTWFGDSDPPESQAPTWHSDLSDPVPVNTYASFSPDEQEVFLEDDIASDTDTSSGSEASAVDPGPDPSRTAQELFWAYRQAKAKWRKFMNKGTRTVRRHFKRFQRRKGKGKGKGSSSQHAHMVGKGKGSHAKGKHSVTTMLAEMSDREIQQVLPAFRGQRSPGKGKGRRGNPKGPDGLQMRCYECNSTEHLAGSCPRRTRASAHTNPSTTFFTTTAATSINEAGPLAGIVQDSFFGRIASSSQHVVFPMDEQDTLLPGQDLQFYMTHEEFVDAHDPGDEPVTAPLTLNDPWSSAPSSQWSFPTSFPQSYGPVAPSGPNRNINPPGLPLNFHMPRGARSEPAWSNSEGSMPMPPFHTTPRSDRPIADPPVNEHANPVNPERTTRVAPMNWADVSQMPTDLRDLLPWPLIPMPQPAELPAFASLPAFEFLGVQQGTPIPRPHTLREPQQSTLEGPLRRQLDDFHFVQQHVEVIRERRQADREARHLNRPAVQVQSQLDPQHRPELHEFHNVQRQVEHRRRVNKKQSAQSHVFDTSDQEYDGAEDTCALCKESYEGGESLLRLVCRHVYHVDCWTQYMVHGPALQCPICRGGCHVVARYRHPHYQRDTSQHASSEPQRSETPPRATVSHESFNIFTPPRQQSAVASNSPEGTPFFSPQGHNIFPWWPNNDNSNDEQMPAAYHTISMPDRHGIIVDPGAYTNLIGEDTARIFAAMAVKNGHEPKQWRMKTMFIQGVGNGQQRCEWKVSLPIACMFSAEGQEPQLCYFEAPVVGGTGSRLPALLGLKSMTAMSASLVMALGKESLHLPFTPDDVGNTDHSRKCPLSRAPSGHLVLLIDHWNALHAKPEAGIRSKPMVLHTHEDELPEAIDQ